MFPLQSGKDEQSPLITFVTTANPEKMIVKTINVTIELKI